MLTGANAPYVSGAEIGTVNVITRIQSNFNHTTRPILHPTRIGDIGTLREFPSFRHHQRQLHFLCRDSSYYCEFFMDEYASTSEICVRN